MEPRWLSLAIVLTLVVGHAAGGVASPSTRLGAVPGEQDQARDGAELLPPQAQRSPKRLEVPRRDGRRTSHEPMPALPPARVAATTERRVELLAPVPASPRRGHVPAARALARAPPAA